MVNTMIRRHTRVLNWMVQLFDQARDLKDSILFALERLKSTDDAKITTNITEIRSVLQK